MSHRFIRYPYFDIQMTIKIYVYSSHNDINFLPTSTTCANYIYLPEYPTYEILKEKFDTVIR